MQGSQLQYWNRKETVRTYSFQHRQVFLFYPELQLLGLFRDRWSRISMLDIGVGGGRTTQYFAELAGKYVGIDFAGGMVEHCRQRFAGRWPGAAFEQGDASDLSGHADNTYDLVLFSFNGIDCLPYEGRLKAMAEMKRVCRPGGLIAYSSHNFYSIPLIPKFTFNAHPLRLWEELLRWWRVNRMNPPVAKAMTGPYATYYDDAIGPNYQIYSRPEQETIELERLGLQDVRRYAFSDGHELRTLEEWQHPSVKLVYYFCRKPGAADQN